MGSDWSVMQSGAPDMTEPRKNANLSPFESWRSAYFCMQNTSYYCTIKDGYTIGMEGVINVHDSDIKNFCNNGCYDHTLYVLTCIKDVKSDFFFQTKQPVSYVWNVTSRACASQLNGFNTNVTAHNPNSGSRVYGRVHMSLVSALTTMAFIATFAV
ncbi:uncharacterized protein HKW66_Vig0128230 [Vigna angularis]|uniref:DUF7731 domain-containing protein n=2 Tax=Phaseolus angularis TaxID=3914 RepID=A0A8T0K313_PHAAN|nr:uncharacterized protein HKW66_Vig0128230 [Vigna angularis]